MPSLPRKATILVVEDDGELRAFYRTVLSMAGYAVVAAEDGVDALRYLDSECPDGILLDLMLPRLAGRDLQQEIAASARTRDIPVVVITGSAHEVQRGSARCVLRKPVTLEQLLETARACFPPPAGFSVFR